MYSIGDTFKPSTDLENPESLGIFALYTKRKDADMALKALERNGFAHEDVSLLAPERSGHRDFVYHQQYSLLPGAIIGAVLGVIILGTVGVFIGDQQFVTDPYSASYLISSSVLFRTIFLGGLGLFIGAAAGALAGIGTPKSAAKRYGFYLKEGGIVVVVHLKKQIDDILIKRILEKTNGQDISTLEESKIWSTIIPEKRKLLTT